MKMKRLLALAVILAMIVALASFLLLLQQNKMEVIAWVIRHKASMRLTPFIC